MKKIVITIEVPDEHEEPIINLRKTSTSKCQACRGVTEEGWQESLCDMHRGLLASLDVP